MTYILYLFTFLPSWFVGPMPVLELPPGSPTIYYIAPGQPLEPTAPGIELVVIVNAPAPAPVPGPIVLPGNARPLLAR